jgi:AcrR family transcriptional regulator
MEASTNAPKKQPKQARSQATVEAIIQATARILSKEGRARLSTNRIAEVAGVSVGSLYQYFPHKEALLAELRSRYEQRFLRDIVRELGQVGRLPLREAVPQFVRFMIGLHAEDPKLHNELSAEIPDSQHETLRAFALVYLEAHRDEVRRENLELAAQVALEAGEALIHRTALHEPERLRDERFVGEVCDLLLRYLAR